jgi:hypothetical protein
MAVARIRKYPHFDADLTVTEAELLTSDPLTVARHPFFPFIDYVERWTKFAQKGISGKPKERPIRYAARRDACIYSYYREMLMSLYEAELTKLSINECVLAYRRVPKTGKNGNKCNIDFANDVFGKISEMGDCFVYALDIEGFFDHIDHAKLKSVWTRLLKQNKLPPDHHCVFKNVTKYASVDREALYRMLGFIGSKSSLSGRSTEGYLVKRVPLQVCDAKLFREKVTSLIKINKKSHGIPQGSPISDVLANMYLLDFDAKVASELAKCGGLYYRYSDDILIIVPSKGEDLNIRLDSIQGIMTGCGEKLIVQDQKSAVYRFQKDPKDKEFQIFKLVHGKQGKNGLEYLGFRFDGSRVYIRDSTRAGLNRKIVLSARKLARIHAKRNPTLTNKELKATFNHNRVLTKFGRVDDFESNEKGYRSWTFWTYAVRAHSVFGHKGSPILRQLSGYKSFVRRKVEEAIDDL